MKTSILTFIIALATIASSAQDKLVTRTGEVSFSSKTAMENIEAKNSQTASIFLVNEKTVAFNVILRSFKFDKALMEEHFNEKYVHSDKYPSAKFKGVIQDDIDLKKPNTYNDVTLKGNMDFHGVKKPITVTADIIVNQDGSIAFTSLFSLKLKDYKVEVPSLVEDKISPEIEINVATKYASND